MNRRWIAVPLIALSLSACSQVAALTPVGGGPVTTVRNAVYDILVTEQVDILVAPQCATSEPGITCTGSTLDGQVILAEAEGAAPYALTITIGSEVIFTGNAEDVLHYLAWVLEHQVAPDQVAGVVIEPVATEGGVFAPSQEFWNSLGALCVKHGWVLCLDEVQTGMGRCGSVLAVDLWEGIEPDLVILGKGLSGGGMPISAILGSDRVMAGSQLSQGSTFGWQPAACAAALASIDILTRPGVLEYVRWMGGEALRILSPLVSLDHVVGARAFGAEVVLGYQLLMPNGLNRSVFLHEYLLEHGVVAMCDEEKPFVRLQPALNLNRDLWRYALHTVADAVTSSG